MVGATVSVITTALLQVTAAPRHRGGDARTAKPSAGASLVGGVSAPAPSQLSTAIAGGAVIGVRGPLQA
jgi:hypothetical protein